MAGQDRALELEMEKRKTDVASCTSADQHDMHEDKQSSPPPIASRTSVLENTLVRDKSGKYSLLL